MIQKRLQRFAVGTEGSAMELELQVSQVSRSITSSGYETRTSVGIGHHVLIKRDLTFNSGSRPPYWWRFISKSSLTFLMLVNIWKGDRIGGSSSNLLIVFSVYIISRRSVMLPRIHPVGTAQTAGETEAQYLEYFDILASQVVDKKAEKHLKSKNCCSRAENCWEMVSSVAKQMDAPGLII